jgi:hypothetical protein
MHSDLQAWPRAWPCAQVSVVLGPYELGDLPAVLLAEHEGLFCLQAYVVPRGDLRYLATYDCTQGLVYVLGRRHSARYSHALDADAASLAPEPVSGGGRRARGRA